MIHENMPRDYIVAVVEEKQRSLRQHRMPSRRGGTAPGRLRRTVAAALVRLAELVVRQPLAQRPIRYGSTSPYVTVASGASARRRGTG